MLSPVSKLVPKPCFAIAVTFAVFVGPASFQVNAHVLGDTQTREDCYGQPLADFQSEQDLPTSELVAELLNWIGTATRYDISASLANPPEIRFCVSGEVVEYEGQLIDIPEHLHGAYDLPARRILLVRPWRPDNPRDRSVLLHELIHHVQLANRRYECVQAPEWEAYQLQHDWLAKQGKDSGFDWFAIYMASRCPRDHHP